MFKKQNRSITNRHKVGLTASLCLFALFIVAQQGAKSIAPIPPKAPRSVVYLEQSTKTRFDQATNPDVRVVEGNVVFRHDSTYVYCDSAYFYQNSNTLEAFSNVRMEQGDTLFVYGDYLHYDGNTKLAKLRENVKMVNRNTTLYTDSLDYDRVLNLGYYFDGGKMVDKENTLTSDLGEYSPATKTAIFRHRVKLVNPRFVLTSDTLKYNTKNAIATILGPSDIVSDNNHIYSEKGFYNTRTDVAELLNRSVLTNQEKKLTGDSLYYDRKKAYGEAFENVILTDAGNKTMLKSHYCYYNEKSENALATKHAVAIDYSQTDSLYMHGDTLQMRAYHLKTDSAHRELIAYHKVRIYRTDIQAVCDSMIYVSKDSLIKMYVDPILWKDDNQLLGEKIYIYTKNSTIDWVHIQEQCLAIEKMDSISYNQVQGKEMKGFFDKGEMKRVEVTGNTRLIYFPKEKDGTLTGMNTSEASQLTMYLVKKKMERVTMQSKSVGVLTPIPLVKQAERYLDNFVLFDYIRPLNKEDIFNWRGKAETQKIKKNIRVDAPEQ